LWPVIYHTEKNSCGNPTPEMLSVKIYTSQQDYPKSTRFYFVAIDVSQQKTVLKSGSGWSLMENRDEIGATGKL
jgi:hypothetical protein